MEAGSCSKEAFLEEDEQYVPKWITDFIKTELFVLLSCVSVAYDVTLKVVEINFNVMGEKRGGRKKLSCK